MTGQNGFMYQQMSERGVLKWALDYTMPWVIRTTFGRLVVPDVA